MSVDAQLEQKAEPEWESIEWVWALSKIMGDIGDNGWQSVDSYEYALSLALMGVILSDISSDDMTSLCPKQPNHRRYKISAAFLVPTLRRRNGCWRLWGKGGQQCTPIDVRNQLLRKPILKRSRSQLITDSTPIGESEADSDVWFKDGETGRRTHYLLLDGHHHWLDSPPTEAVCQRGTNWKPHPIHVTAHQTESNQQTRYRLILQIAVQWRQWRKSWIEEELQRYGWSTIFGTIQERGN